MKFEEFKEAMEELRQKGYISTQTYEDHIFVRIIEQREKELDKMIESNIIKLWKKVNTIGGYVGSYYKNYMFISTEKMSQAFKEAKNYDEAIEILESENISYISILSLYGEGTKKEIRVEFKNHRVHYNSFNFQDAMQKMIKDTMPDNVSCSGDFYIKFNEGIEWERRKSNCKELEIEEEFDKLFRKYE